MSDTGSKIKEEQKKLRSMQIKRDNGNTFGHESRDPCKKERQMSLNCIDANREDTNVCKDYFDNFRLCKKFWNSVQEYRVQNMRKSRYDYPKDEEYQMWKKKLPEWLNNGYKITPPYDDKSNENKSN